MLKRKRTIWIVGLVSTTACVVALAVGWFGAQSEFVAQDACMDSGGRWSESQSCQFEQLAG